MMNWEQYKFLVRLIFAVGNMILAPNNAERSARLSGAWGEWKELEAKYEEEVETVHDSFPSEPE